MYERYCRGVRRHNVVILINIVFEVLCGYKYKHDLMLYIVVFSACEFNVR